MLHIFTTKKDYSLLSTLKSKKLVQTFFLHYYSSLKIENSKIYENSKLLSVTSADVITLRDPRNIVEQDYTPILYFFLNRSNKIFEKNFLTRFLNYEDKIYQISIYQKYFNHIKIPKFKFPINKMDKHKYPMMLKKRVSSRNRGNILIKEKSELRKIRKINEYFEQEVIQFDNDLRFLFLYGDLIAVVNRKKDKTGKLKIYKEISKEISPVIILELRNLVRELDIHFAGIDVLQKGLDYYFLELNISPQYSGVEQITNLKIGEKLINNIDRYL